MSGASRNREVGGLSRTHHIDAAVVDGKTVDKVDAIAPEVRGEAEDRVDSDFRRVVVAAQDQSHLTTGLDPIATLYGLLFIGEVLPYLRFMLPQFAHTTSHQQISTRSNFRSRCAFEAESKHGWIGPRMQQQIVL